MGSPRVGFFNQAAVGEGGVSGDFFSNPRGKDDFLGGRRHFDFSGDEALVLSVEDVDFPKMFFVGDAIAGFFNLRGERNFFQEVFGIGDGDGVFEFGPDKIVGTAFDGEEGLLTGEADADDPIRVGAEVGLAVEGAWMTVPWFAMDKEFSFDFEAHAE
jgi:hypothetical protein